jgi:hypothetical protein
MRDGHDAEQANVKSSKSSLLSNFSTGAVSKLIGSVQLNMDSMRLEGLNIWRKDQVLPISDNPNLSRLC